MTLRVYGIASNDDLSVTQEPRLTGAVKGGGLIRQTTLKNSIRCRGVGLHTGTAVTMVLRPAAPNSGISFRRTDGAARGILIPARFDHVVNTRMCTVLGNWDPQGEAPAEGDRVTVSTVEHLMAAFAGSGIDNAIVDIDGPEVPVMDGSAAPFVFLIECAGVTEQQAPRRFLSVERAIEIDEGERMARLEPASEWRVSCEINFDNKVISRQSGTFEVTARDFKSALAPARTFGFEHEVAYLRANGLALGGSLDNAVVVSGDRILNKDGLRFGDEFVRHKALDSIGDLYLAGMALKAHFVGTAPGHALNNALLRKLFATPGASRVVHQRAADIDAEDMAIGAPAMAVNG